MPLVTPTCNSLLVYLLLIHVSLCPISVIVILSRTLIVFVLALPPPSFFFLLFGLEVLDRTRCWYPGRVELFLYLADQCLDDKIYIRIVYWISSDLDI